ncbi:MAG: DUF421 domain-containing protein [Bacillus sp. (in: firmicutes)]
MNFFHIFVELVVGFFALLFLTKILGKTEITQITTFDFVSVLVLGELVGNAMYDTNIGLGKILFAIAIWGLLIYITEFFTQKFRSTRKLFEGKPSIIINKGQINFNELKKNHLDLNQLQHLLRTKDVFSITECYYAILETDGTVNVMKNQLYSPPTKQDLKLPIQPASLPISLILDGEIILENLAPIGWDEQKVKEELLHLGISSYKDVLYAEWKEDTPLYVQSY